MPVYLNNAAIKSTVAIETKKIDEVDPRETNLNTKQPENNGDQDTIVFPDFLSDDENERDFEKEYDTKNDLNNSSNNLKKGSVENTEAFMYQSANIENLEKLNSLNITFHKGHNYQQWEVANIVNQIKSDPQATKLVKISFQHCTYVTDFELAYIGAGIGSKLGNAEYLNLSFWDSRRITVFGIQEFIKQISGQGNTLKSLRLRIRSHWYLGNQSLKDLIKGIRTALVNLEELQIVLSGNLWVTSRGVKAVKDDERVIEGLGLGLKKYEINAKWYLASLFKDKAGNEMNKYALEKFREMDVKEGALVSNKMFVYYQRVLKSSVVSHKVVLGDLNKSA